MPIERGLVRAALTRAVVLLSLAILPFYAFWRVFATGGGAFAPLFVVVLVAEACSIVRYLGLTLPSLPGRPPPPDEAQPVTSDVLVVVATEPLLLVRTAVHAALQVRGVGRVVVLDTIGRSDLARYCEGIDVACHVQPAGVPEGLESEFLTLIPASRFLHPDALEVTSNSFVDAAVAAVTGEVRADTRSELVGASGYLLAADKDAALARLLDRLGVATPLYGPLICRRSALDELHTSEWQADRFLLSIGAGLHRRGHRIRPSARPIASCRLPWSEGAALRTRARLANGRSELALSGGFSGLSRPQRLVYALPSLELFASATTMVGFVIPVICALTGFLPLTASFLGLAVMGAPWLLVSGIARRLADQSREPIGSHLRRVARTALVDLRVLGRHDDPVPSAQAAANMQASTAMVLFGFSVSAALLPFSGFAMAPMSKLATSGVLIASLVLLWLARDVYLAIEDRQHRSMARYQMPQIARTPHGALAVRTVSPLGIDADTERDLKVGEQFVVTCKVPLPDGSVATTEAPAQVMRVGSTRTASRVYMEFLPNEQLFDELLYFCSVSAALYRAQKARVHVVQAVRPIDAATDPQRQSRVAALDLRWLHDEIATPVDSVLQG